MLNDLSDKDQIAIVGMAGRFPGANNVDKFWQNIRDGVESISFFTDDELLSVGINPSLLKDPSYVKAQGVLENIELFDAAFFGFSPREAEITDPQHRLFIECVWEALENAGYNSQTYDGQIGVFAGVGVSNYLLSNLYSNRELIESADNFQILLGNDKDFLSTHISYKLNLRGPSINIQTACSTSLVTVHLACQSLLNGESDIALAGGVSIKVPQKTGYNFQEGGIKSPDGHCRAFDAKAKGTNDGNGLGVVVLKRLDDAVADGDFIHAIIKGSSVNNDGSLKVGYTAPSVNGQREVILEALALAGVEPETIAYIETHGTGTQLGDPIEIKALTQAFRASTDKKGFCAIASVKTNVGHLDTAAGVTGLIKTVQVLKHKQIPSSLHFQEPNPQIDFANSPFYVNTNLSEWKTHNGIPRRAGVSSFGIGGTNVHVILEEAPVIEGFPNSRPWQLLLLSAKTSTALETTTANLAAHLQQHPDINLPDVAYTLQVGRWAFEHRRMVVCRNLDNSVKLLVNPDLKYAFKHQKLSSHCPVIFMFSGQGAQYVNMARELYEVEPTFRNYIDTCAEILQPYLNLDIRHIVYPTAENIEVASQQLQQTAFTQPVLFVIEYALAQLWMEWGVRPEAMIGHSIGEYVAATIAGVFSLEDALVVVATRGQLMQQLPTGSMLAIPLPQKDVQALLDVEPLYKKYLQVAAINSQSSCVVSGSHEAIATLKNQLSIKKTECRLLHTSHAFHSQMMTPILELFVETLEKLKLKPPKIRFISNVTGTWISDEQATNPSYWSQHLRQTVRFSDGISQLLQQFEGIFLEVGPGRTLSTLTTQHLNNKAKQQVLTSLCHAKEQQSDISFLLQTLGKLWLFGVEIDWSGFYAHEQRYRVPLPTYPFERQRYWIDAKSPSDANSKPATLNKKQDIADWFYIPSWKRSLLSHSSSPQIDSDQEWLLFVDEFGVGDKLSNRLKNQGKNVTLVQAGEHFGSISEGIYTINPYNSHDYDALFEELTILGKIPQNIAYFWSLNNFDNRQYKYLEFNSLLLLTQTFSKLTTNEKLQLLIVSNQIQEVTGNEIINSDKAIILGLCKVIPQEYPNITCRSIDITLINQKGEYNNYIIDQVFRECNVLSSDLVVAYRDRYRWVQVFEAVRLDSVVEEKIPLRKQGVYLFFGGLESFGVVLAEYLAKTLQATLILIENSAFPEKDDYSQWLKTHSQEDEISCKIQKLLTLEQLGAKVLLMRVDITNYEHTHQNLAPENIGEIHGVVYSNGITHENIFCSIPEISKPKLEKVLESQRHKIGVLEQVLQNRKLDFCILLSSLSPVLGGSGLALDSAINLFANTFIYQNKLTQSSRWYTINLDLELDATQEEKTFGKASKMKLAMTPTESVEVFKRILSLGEGSQVIVSTVDINARSDRTFNSDSPSNSKFSAQVDLSSRYSRPNLNNSCVAPTNELEKQIVEIWQEVLGISQVGIYDNFYDLGGDSLIATQLISRLRAKFPVELPLRELLEALIVAKQAEVIENLLLDKIEELSEDEVALLLANE